MSKLGLAILLVGACITTGCATEHAAADLVIVQLDRKGGPTSCWELEGAELTDMQDLGTTTWRDEHANIIVIPNPSRRVQVSNDNWDAAFTALGLRRGVCRTLRNHRVQQPTARIGETE